MIPLRARPHMTSFFWGNHSNFKICCFKASLLSEKSCCLSQVMAAPKAHGFSEQTVQDQTVPSDLDWWLHQCWGGWRTESHKVAQLPHLLTHQILSPRDQSRLSKAGTAVKIVGSFSFRVTFFFMLRLLLELIYFCYFFYSMHYSGMKCLCVI